MLFETIYIEQEIAQHPFVEKICRKFSSSQPILCERYGEIFNRQQQNFKLQKQHPSLILAKKYGNFVLPTPVGYGIGGTKNYYFSHMLNCIYDCRYCFLQGMYNSAHYVVFVNYEDFAAAIAETAKQTPEEEVYFFSGYDCDSLALENVTHFVEACIPLFRQIPNAILELRTKSISINRLLQIEPLPNCVIAYTLSPNQISDVLEHRAPPLHRRLRALSKLQERGWKIGLRFDPLIYCEQFTEIYSIFFAEAFAAVLPQHLHSVTMGTLRFPKHIFKKMYQLYPNEPLLASGLKEEGKQITYGEDIEQQLFTFCKEQVLRYIPQSIFYPCEVL